MREYEATCSHTTHALCPRVQNILLRYLPNLRTLDLGFDSRHFIMDWNITPVRVPLTYRSDATMFVGEVM